MAWLDIFQRRSAPTPLPFEQVMERIDNNGNATSVSINDAMQVNAVMACVRAIANGCATPELYVYRLMPDGTRQLATDLPEFRLLNRRPNEWQTSYEFRRTMTMHAALTGDALAVKVKVGGRVRELIPVKPGNFQIDRTSRYSVQYRVSDEFGLVGVFGPQDVFHLPNASWDSVKGLSAVRLAATAIGLSIAAEKTQATFHNNGGRPSGLLSTDNNLGPEGIARLRDAWNDWTRRNRNGTAVMDNGMKYTALAMTGVDAQHLETRRFQVEEICRAFDLFPMMIGHADKTATFASSEAFFGGHRIHTLTPWHQLWTQRLDEFVLDGDGPLFAGFDVRYLTAASIKDRAMWARTMAEMGIYTRNELRDEEGRDPLPGLNDPLTPLNMSGGSNAEGATDENV